MFVAAKNVANSQKAGNIIARREWRWMIVSMA